MKRTYEDILIQYDTITEQDEIDLEKANEIYKYFYVNEIEYNSIELLCPNGKFICYLEYK